MRQPSEQDPDLSAAPEHPAPRPLKQWHSKPVPKKMPISAGRYHPTQQSSSRPRHLLALTSRGSGPKFFPTCPKTSRFVQLGIKRQWTGGRTHSTLCATSRTGAVPWAIAARTPHLALRTSHFPLPTSHFPLPTFPKCLAPPENSPQECKYAQKRATLACPSTRRLRRSASFAPFAAPPARPSVRSESSASTLRSESVSPLVLLCVPLCRRATPHRDSRNSRDCRVS